MFATRHVRLLCLILAVVSMLTVIGVHADRLIGARTFGLAFAGEGADSEAKVAESSAEEAGERGGDLPSQAERDQESAMWEAERRGQLQSKDTREEKIDELNAELEKNPEDFELHYKLANAYHEADYPHSALAHFDKASSLKPGDSRIWVNRGVLLKELARAEEAEASFRKAIEINAADPLAHINLGDLFLTQKKYPEAVDKYREALRVEPESPNAYYSLAIAFAESGMYRDAARAWHTCAELAQKRGGPLDAGNAERALENAKLMDQILADAETKVREREEKERELEATGQDKKADKSD
jgi:Flp pilus assembly protein TadD